MNVIDDENLLAYCLGDLDSAARQQIEERLQIDDQLRSRLLFVRQATTEYRRLSPASVRTRRRYKLLAFAVATAACLFLGMLIQAQFEVLRTAEPVAKPVTEPLSWDGPSEQIL